MPRPAHSFGLSDIATGKLVSAPYICRSCRHLALRQRVTSWQSLRHASSEEIPITEKVRRKIWGTDNPPGLADPYGGESFLEKRRKERALQKEAQELKESEEEHATPAMLGRSGGTTQAMDSNASSDYLPNEYARSETWDGLEHLGHKGHWRDMPPKPEDEFHPFLNPDQLKASKPEHFLAAIHQATVEVITLQQAGKDLNLGTLATNWYPEIQELIARTKVEVSPGKAQPMLTYPTENTKGTIIGWFLKRQRQELQKQAKSVSADADSIDGVSKTSEAELEESDMLDANETTSTTASAAEDQFNHAADLEEAAVVEDEKLAGLQGGEFETQHHPGQHSPRPTKLSFFYEGVEAPALDADQSYLDMKLNFKDELTYFLFRRITQLTGLRIPDPVLAKAKTLRSIYTYQLEAIKPKPKNLAETLAMKSDLTSLPNVKIIGRRETPVDREKAVGRWKIIEAELRSRGLPVLGRVEV